MDAAGRDTRPLLVPRGATREGGSGFGRHVDHQHRCLASRRAKKQWLILAALDDPAPFAVSFLGAALDRAAGARDRIDNQNARRVVWLVGGGEVVGERRTP